MNDSNNAVDTNQTSGSTTNSKGCIWLIVVVIALIGLVADKYGFLSKTFDNCDVCGKYIYKEYAQNVFSDKEISDMVGADRVGEYKKKLKDEPAALHLLELSEPETVENGKTRGTAIFTIQSKFSKELLRYKGKFLVLDKGEKYDGFIRIEYTCIDASDWEQITFSNDQNIIFYRITSDGIIFDTAGNINLDGIASYKEANFIKD